MNVSRWMLLALACVLELIGGSGYAFGIFSAVLKEHGHNRLGFSQSDTDFVATAGNVGLYLSVIGGLVYGRFGPRTIIIGGGLLYGIGTFLLWSAASGHIPVKSVWVVAIFNFISQHGCGWLSCAGVTISVQNFPSSDRGKVVGMTKGLFGLGSTLYAEIYTGIFSPHPLHFLLFLSIFSPVSCCAIASLISPLPTHLKDTYRYDFVRKPSFRKWAAHLLFLALTLLIAVVVQNMKLCDVDHSDHDCVPARTPRLLFLIGCCLLIALIPVLPFAYGPVLISDGTDKLLLGEREEDEKEQEKPTQETKDVTVLTVIATLRFWFLFIAFALSAGAGLLIINNISQITESLAGEGNPYLAKKNALVAIIGFFSFAGRTFIGHYSDIYGHKLPRVGFLLICVAGMGLAQLLLALLLDMTALFVSCCVVGFFYGGVFCCCASLMADMFGRKNFAANYGAADLAPSIGSIGIAAKLAGTLYDRHANDDGVCYGEICYKWSFFIAFGCCGIACLSTLGLWWCLRKPKTINTPNNVITVPVKPSPRRTSAEAIRPVPSEPVRTRVASSPATTAHFFGVDLERQAHDYQGPTFAVTILKYFLVNEGFKVEGIFRDTGCQSTVAELKRNLESDGNIGTLFQVRDPHVVVSLLKLWLQELPQPLIPRHILPKMMKTLRGRRRSSEISSPPLGETGFPLPLNDDDGSILMEFVSHIQVMPVENRKTLAHLMRMLYAVAQHSQVNHMTELNLSSLLTPILDPSRLAGGCLLYMIINFQRVFFDYADPDTRGVSRASD